MIVGVLKEIKAEENRVCMTPAGVEIMGQNGHTVLVEKNESKRQKNISQLQTSSTGYAKIRIPEIHTKPGQKINTGRHHEKPIPGNSIPKKKEKKKRGKKRIKVN